MTTPISKRAHLTLIALDAQLRLLLVRSPSDPATEKLFQIVSQLDFELAGADGIYGSTERSRLALAARPYILNDPTELRDQELARAILTLRDAEPELDLLDIITGAIDHRVENLGLVVERDRLALSLVEALEPVRAGFELERSSR